MIIAPTAKPVVPPDDGANTYNVVPLIYAPFVTVPAVLVVTTVPVNVIVLVAVLVTLVNPKKPELVTLDTSSPTDIPTIELTGNIVEPDAIAMFAVGFTVLLLANVTLVPVAI